jgi:hypothetical protein
MVGGSNVGHFPRVASLIWVSVGARRQKLKLCGGGERQSCVNGLRSSTHLKFVFQTFVPK